jgi:hypothetical protein
MMEYLALAIIICAFVGVVWDDLGGGDGNR